jgi:cytochrome c1
MHFIIRLGFTAFAWGTLSAMAFAQNNTAAPAPAQNTAAPVSNNAVAMPARTNEAAQPAPAAQAAASSTPPPALPMKQTQWPFEGPFGTFDRASLQRGFQVYKEVCSACHSLKRVAFRNLGEPGGPDFTAAEVKAIAAGFKVPAEPNDQGRTYDDSGVRLTRNGTPADYFPSPFENDQAARVANNGALPPDLSVIIKAREGGPDYVYSILTGFDQPIPATMHMQPNMNYNPYFAGWQIAMPPPLHESLIAYTDGTKATVDQMARDAVTFLSWTAEPKMEERKRLGFGVMIYLVVLSGLLYLAYQRIWLGKH